jgi:pyrroloquinoline quinone biosynthesis protein D
VSEVGERIVELIDGKRSVGEIVEVLVNEFEVERGVAEADTLDFIALLANKHVLTL